MASDLYVLIRTQELFDLFSPSYSQERGVREKLGEYLANSQGQLTPQRH